METASETDLGSAASSVNTSGDEQEAEDDEEEDSDPEIQFKKSTSTTTTSSPSTTRRRQRRTTRASSKNSSSRNSSRNNSPLTLSKPNTNTSAMSASATSPAPVKRGRGRPPKNPNAVQASLAAKAANANDPATITTTSSSSPSNTKRPRISRKSSITESENVNDQYVEEELKRKKGTFESAASPNKNAAATNNNSNKRPAPPSRRSRRTTSKQPSSASSTLGTSPGDSRVECKLCGTRVSDLKDHAFEDHFKEEVMASLPSNRPFECPKCEDEFDSLENLTKHFVDDHDVMEAYLIENKMKTELQNGRGFKNDQQRTSRSSSSAISSPVTSSLVPSSSELFDPPSAWLVPKPRNYNDYCKQVRTNLRTSDGQFAEAVDDRSVKCVCGKNIRINMRFNWRYLIQRPCWTNGKVQVKGHWFMCQEVARAGSEVDDWTLNRG